MARSTVSGTALVLASSWQQDSNEQGDGIIDAAVDYLFSSRKYDLDLEVRAGGTPPFRVSGRFKSPSRLGGITKALIDWRIVPGMTLPVTVAADGLGLPIPGGKVEVDWKAFAYGGGIRAAAAATERHRTERTATALGRQLQRNPKQYDQIRASAIQAGPMMAANVRSGSQTQADFVTWLLFQQESRVLTTQEAQQLWGMAGLPGTAPAARVF